MTRHWIVRRLPGLDGQAIDIIVGIDDAPSMRYPGGKGKCYQRLINLMPVHEVYIESHLGGGAVLRHKRRAARNIGIEADERVVAKWRELRVPDLELVHGDAIEFLKGYSYSGRELVYVDPPYLPRTRRAERIYRHDYTQEHHVALLDLVRTMPCAVLLSGYDDPLYRTALRGWRHLTFNAKSHVGVREESVWMNYPEPTVLHDARYLGECFRERQQIQRRHRSLQRRIAAMTSVERTEFLRWMTATYGDKPCNTAV